jgi:NADH-quinone oxidoreductase subunit L
LVLLAIPSVLVGAFFVDSILQHDYFQESIFNLTNHPSMVLVKENLYNGAHMFDHSWFSLVCWLSFSGWFFAWVFYVQFPGLSSVLRSNFSSVYSVLKNKYWFDDFNQYVFASGSVMFGNFLWKVGDVLVIDGIIVNGSAKFIGRLAKVFSKLQTGYLYHYVFSMSVGLFLFLFYYTYITVVGTIFD